MKYTQSILSLVLCPLLICIPCMTGCSQSKTNQVVQNIANWSPVISNDATTLLTEIASFDTADAAQISSAVTTIQADSQLLTTAANQYLSSPNSTTLGQISNLVSTLSTTDSQALLAAGNIKDANSQKIAEGVLTTLATAVAILATYLESINISVSTPATTALNNMKHRMDKTMLLTALNTAKEQNLVPQNTSLNSFGF